MRFTHYASRLPSASPSVPVPLVPLLAITSQLSAVGSSLLYASPSRLPRHASRFTHTPRPKGSCSNTPTPRPPRRAPPPGIRAVSYQLVALVQPVPLANPQHSELSTSEPPSQHSALRTSQQHSGRSTSGPPPACTETSPSSTSAQTEQNRFLHLISSVTYDAGVKLCCGIILDSGELTGGANHPNAGYHPVAPRSYPSQQRPCEVSHHRTSEEAIRHQRKEVTVKYLPTLFGTCMLVSAVSCAPHPSYTVCRGEDYCTGPLTHEEAMQASQLKKTWDDEKLYVRPTGK
jgi:hypothetical protein